MKIGIVTLFGNTNYGNRLQNYAVQEIIKKRGFEAETIVCKNINPRVTASRVYHAVMALLGDKKSRRMAKFNRFNREMIKTRVVHKKNGSLPVKLVSEYDFFVTGSDQVWNPEIRISEKDLFFLRFARKEQRICLSPSIAVDSIPESYMTEYKIGLNGFCYLSCREEAGAELISKITGKVCQSTLDPTMVIDSQAWRNFAKPISQRKPYVLLFFLGKVPENARRIVEEQASQRSIDIIEISSVKDRHFVSSPMEFVWLVDNAELVLTDSFHGTAFSINLNTPFYVFSRQSERMVENRMVSRIISLTDKFGLSERYVKSEMKAFDFTCDFEYANAMLESERKVFDNYLEQCLKQNEIPSNLLPDKGCTGCHVCEKVCPNNCITMQSDAEGFIRPVIDHEKCVSCKVCTTKCPVLNSNELMLNEIQHVYAAVNIDKEKWNRCSSGAVFPLLAEQVIRESGVVFGAAFTDDFDVAHDWAETIVNVSRFYTSKYVESNIGECFSKVKDFLNGGRTVLFSGTPCQIAGLRKYLGKNYERLILVECACHGVPSPNVWSEYKKYISDKYLHGEPISYVNFREKINEKLFFIRVCSKTHSYVCSRQEDAYFKGFLNNLILRPSCVSCKFKGTKRVADITLADFWGIEAICPDFPIKEGSSMVLVNTMKGKLLWDKIVTDEIYTQKIRKECVIGKVNSAIWKPVIEHRDRRLFFNSFRTMSIDDALVFYGKPVKIPILKRVYRRVKRIFL